MLDYGVISLDIGIGYCLINRGYQFKSIKFTKYSLRRLENENEISYYLFYFFFLLVFIIYLIFMYKTWLIKKLYLQLFKETYLKFLKMS